MGLILRLGRFSGEGKWQPNLIFLPERSHGQRSLTGYSPKSCKELDMTEKLQRHMGRKGQPERSVNVPEIGKDPEERKAQF